MTHDLDPKIQVSLDFCREQTRKSADSFYWGIFSLNPTKRDALCAAYYWFRVLDDLVDNGNHDLNTKHRLLEEFESTTLALHAQAPILQSSTVVDARAWPALSYLFLKYEIEIPLLQESIAGARMDLEQTRYQSMQELELYCHRVASLVGVICLKIFGTLSPSAIPLGEKLGIALQLTNILRDVPEDYERGRIYIPQDLLVENNCSEEDLVKTPLPPEALAVFKSLHVEALSYYQKSWPLLQMIETDARASLFLISQSYWALAQEIKLKNFSQDRKIRLSKWKKLKILLASRLRRNQSFLHD